MLTLVTHATVWHVFPGQDAWDVRIRPACSADWDVPVWPGAAPSSLTPTGTIGLVCATDDVLVETAVRRGTLFGSAGYGAVRAWAFLGDRIGSGSCSDGNRLLLGVKIAACACRSS